MAKEKLTQLEQLKDYARQLKRHTKGRKAIHVQISNLERYHQEPYYKREASACLKPILDNFPGSKNFSLSNNDLILLTNGAEIDDIERPLNQIRQLFKDDILMRNIDPIQGKSDIFSIWYDLDTGYDELMDNIESMLSAESIGEKLTKSFQPKPSSIKVQSDTAVASSVKPSGSWARGRMVKIERTDAHELPKVVKLDAEILLKLEKFIKSMDIENFMSLQNIMAIVGQVKPQVALVERSVDVEAIINQLIPELDLDTDIWLKGYLTEMLAYRLMRGNPELSNPNSIASLIPLSIDSILGPYFEDFLNSHKQIDRSKIVVEIAQYDLLNDITRYEEAERILRGEGYKIAIGEMDPFAFTIMDTSLLKADFFKVKWRDSSNRWLMGENLKNFRASLKRVGTSRIIITNCKSEVAIVKMQSAGVVLFQGSAAEGF